MQALVPSLSKNNAQASDVLLGTWPTTVLLRITATVYDPRIGLLIVAEVFVDIGCPNHPVSMIAANGAIDFERNGTSGIHYNN